jgi:hypothetical protein
LPPKEWDEQSLVAYLLGDLPELEVVRLEDAYFSEPKLFELLEALERELQDEYLRGAMTGRRLQLFERRYGVVGCGSSRLDAEREWFEAARMVRASSGRSSKPQHSFFEKWPVAWPTVPYLKFGIALCTVVIAGWLVFHLPGGRTPGSVSNLSSRQGASVAYLLRPGRERSAAGDSGSNAAAPIVVPSTASTVLLHLQFDAKVASGRYRASIRPVGRQDAWSGPATGPPGATLLDVEVPASALGSKDYVLKLEVWNGNPTWTTVESYFFQVDRR